MKEKNKHPKRGGSHSEKILILKRRIKFLFWSGVSRILYGNAIFLDANIVIHGQEYSDKQIKKILKHTQKYFLTDVVEKEINNLNDKYKIVSFNKLREISPSLCPVYYYITSLMYSPANIASPHFALHMLQSLKLKGRNLTSSQISLYDGYMRRLEERATNEKTNGEVKTLFAKHLDKSIHQYFKKKIKNNRSINLLNDYKNLSTILLFTLLNKKNTTFVTADRDLLAIILTFAEGLAQGVTFPYLFLPTLTDDNKKEMFSGKRITKFLDFKEFRKQYKNVFDDIINHYCQKDHVSLKIRLWDNEKKCFIEDMLLNFDNAARDIILNLHGPLACPYVKNDTHGNWLHYYYWPPPPKSPDVVKTVLSIKKVKSRYNIYVPDSVHQKTCRYALEDQNNELKNYSGFWL